MDEIQKIPVLLDEVHRLMGFRSKMGLHLCAYVHLDNHLHLIVGSENLSKTVQSFKSFTARRLLKGKRGGVELDALPL